MHCAVLAFVPRVLFSLIVFLINLIVLLQSNSLFLVMNSEVCVWYIAICKCYDNCSTGLAVGISMYSTHSIKFAVK